MSRRGDCSSREHKEHPTLACHGDAATIDGGHGSPTQVNTFVASASTDRVGRID